MNGDRANWLAVMSQFPSLTRQGSGIGEAEYAFDGIRAACVLQLASYAGLLHHLEVGETEHVNQALRVAADNPAFVEVMNSRLLVTWRQKTQENRVVDEPSWEWFEAFRVVEAGVLDTWPLKRAAMLLATGVVMIGPELPEVSVTFDHIIPRAARIASGVLHEGVTRWDEIYVEMLSDLADFYQGLTEYGEFVRGVPDSVHSIMAEYVRSTVCLGHANNVVGRLRSLISVTSRPHSEPEGIEDYGPMDRRGPRGPWDTGIQWIEELD